ncbi:MAG: serine/threonine protein kinase [Deltaproteobacteria bacterium]|nr:serine/threonine protein kinase [Deltaproteobacteria bacterium]
MLPSNPTPILDLTTAGRMNLTIADKYEILRPLGQGGMAEVLLAKQRGVVGIDKLVVIKRILPQYASEQSFVAMFLDEARVAADLVHPNVVSVHEAGESDGSYYLVLEYLQGRDLRRLQRRLEKSTRPIPAGHVVRIALDAAEGLHYAHTKNDLEGRAMNIVHRDVSPQNIVVTWDGSAKILDFGIAKADSQQEHTETGIIKGKYTYMSPEQARGEKVDARSDQFSLGVILWELLTGKRLYKRDNDVAIVTAICEEKVSAPSDFADLPDDLDKVVLKMLNKDPADRYDSLRDVTLALEDCVSNSSLSASQARLGTYLEDLFLEELERERRLNDIGGNLLFEKTQSQAGDDDNATVLDEKVRSTVLQAQRFPLRLDDDSTAPARSRMRAPIPWVPTTL